MIGGEISITVSVFTLDYFQEKLMTKYFNEYEEIYIYENEKINIKMNFPGKRALSVFKYFNELISHS